jgi:catechol 2,3-dioxygenase-like lactoylglutathione lyase family enzyme
MSVIKVVDLAYVRIQVPDLDKAEQFFRDFGFIISARTPTSVHARAHDAESQVVIAQPGPRRLLSIAFKCGSREDLDRVANHAGTTVTKRDEFGGGWQTTIQDPDGTNVELVWGIDAAEPVVLKRSPMNVGAERNRRTGDLCRPPAGASHVLRFGHIVVTSPQPVELGQWYRDMFGLLVSDEVTDDDGNELLSFNRLDRGEEYVDHHTFQTAPGAPGKVHHISFEVHDLDDLQLGHAHLASKGYKHMWGIGRHLQGSQIFDYWLDPFGFMFEHWIDTDLLNAASKPSKYAVSESIGPWGPPLPEAFARHSA